MAAINEKMQKALNAHINVEVASSYLYLAMAAYFEASDLPGFANWMRVQVKEEDFHAQRFFDYVIARHGRVILEAIERPPTEWDSPLAAFEAAFAHEQMITSRINDLINLAVEHRDRATENMLHWFINEQVEEEANVDRIVKQLRLGGNAPTVMLMLDRELATRVFVPPTTPAP
jgi:ferritin